MVLIFDPDTNEVMSINAIGTKLIKIKKINFLSFKLNLNFNFLINNETKKKKGNNIPICFDKKRIGYLKLSKIFAVSRPVLLRP